MKNYRKKTPQKFKVLLIVVTWLSHATFSFGQDNSLAFIQNLGQWHENVEFRLKLPETCVFIEENAITYLAVERRESHDHLHEFDSVEETSEDTIKKHAWRVEFLNGNSENVRGEEVRKEYFNFFIGADSSKWKSNVPAYNRVRHKSIYNGIDMFSYIQGARFKYDLVVAPHVNPDQIELVYEGVEGLHLEEKNLIIETSIGQYMEASPIAYQIVNNERIAVECEFKITDSTVSFVFPKGYQEDHTLIIDPELIASTHMGTTIDAAFGCGATYDDDGNIYSFAALSEFTVFPTTPGAYTEVGAGLGMIGISKLSPDGSEFIFSTYLGGTTGGGEMPMSGIFYEGNICVVGNTFCTDFPVTVGAYQPTYAGGSDLFVSRLSADGATLNASTYVGGNQIEGFGAEVVYEDEHFYIVSQTNSPDFPVSVDAFQSEIGGGLDGVVMCLNESLTDLEWSTFLGNTSTEVLRAIHCNEGHVYVAGSVVLDPLFPVIGYETEIEGLGSGIIARFSLDGTAVTASTLINSTSGSTANVQMMEIGPEGNVYVYGIGNVESTPGVYSEDGREFIQCYNSDLTELLFSVNMDAGAAAGALMVDACRNVYFSGEDYSDAWPPMTTDDVTFAAYGGGFAGSMYFAVFNPDATELLYASTFGSWGDHTDEGRSYFSPDGTLYQSVCVGSAFPTTPDAVAPDDFTPWAREVAVFKVNIAPTVLPPTVSLDVEEGCSPLIVNFSCDDISEGTTTTWDFGDGSPVSDEPEVEHTFTDEGVYIVTLIVEDSTACIPVDTSYFEITVYPPPGIDLGVDTTICFGNTLLLDAGPGDSFLWQDGSNLSTFTVVEPGEYWVEAGFDGCLSNDTILVEFVGHTVDLGPDTALCIIDLLLNAENEGLEYLWQDGSTEQTFNVIAPGTYFVSVNDPLLGCTNSDSVIISVGSINVDLGPDILICEMGEVTLDAGLTDVDYLWSDGSEEQTLDVNEEGVYKVTVTRGLCVDSDSIAVNYQEPIALFSVADTAGCVRTAQNTHFTDLSISAVEIVEWLWDFGDGTTSDLQNPLHMYAGNGIYEVSLTITTVDGCVVTYARNVEIMIYFYPIAGFTFNPVVPVINDEMTFENNSINANSWTWDFGDGHVSELENPTHIYNDIDLYQIMLIAENNGCTDTAFSVIIPEEPLIVYVPNVFTPDGDNFNERFIPVFTSGFDPYDYHLTIFNRWGEQIFESFNADFGWDGTYGNMGLVQDGVYIWKIEFGDINNDKRYVLNGHVSVLK